MQNTPEIKDEKLTKYLRKDNFYKFFQNYVKCYKGMKNEMTEIVANYREIPISKARNIRNFKYPEVQKFIAVNDFKTLFVA
ncbi:hypothetical protein [Tenacibaculum maritimum]|uniref:hypothetical protein n=1 Tax=Tenacibaculum maritimum TaxID=107401 RepID=UPI003876A3F3